MSVLWRNMGIYINTLLLLAHRVLISSSLLLYEKRYGAKAAAFVDNEEKGMRLATVVCNVQ